MKSVMVRTGLIVLVIMVFIYGLIQYRDDHRKVFITNTLKTSHLAIENNGKLIYKNGVSRSGKGDVPSAEVGKLYISNIDGSHKKRISNKVVSSIFVSGEAIYYSTQVDPGSTIYGYDVYLTNEEGTYTKKICHCMYDSIQLSEKRIYYLEGDIKSINANGSKRMEVYNSGNQSLWKFIVCNKEVFFTSFSKEGLFRVSTDGQNFTEICSSHVGDFYILNNWIYLDKETNGIFAYKVNINGGKILPVSPAELSSLEHSRINIISESQYYVKDNMIVKESFKDRRISNISKSKDVDDENDIEIIGSYVYYINRYDGCIYRISIDGVEKTRL